MSLAQLREFIIRDWYVRDREHDPAKRRYGQIRYRVSLNRPNLAEQQHEHHRVERDGAIDLLQGIQGYFNGGGWAFGLTEAEGHRFSSQSYADYETTLDNGSFSLLTVVSD
jgi:hypothetical protein